MEITKSIKDDKKQKHNSFELCITVPAMPIPPALKQTGGYLSEEDTEYTSYYSSLEAAEKDFEAFLEYLSRHYNRPVSFFVVKSA